MKNYEVNKEVLENGVLSAEKLQNSLQEYSQRVDNVATTLLSNTDIESEDIADEFFNSIDEEVVVSFETEKNQIQLLLSRSVGLPDDDEMELTKEHFGSGYLVEIRNLNEELEDGIDFELGDEEEVIQKLQELGMEFLN